MRRLLRVPLYAVQVDVVSTEIQVALIGVAGVIIAAIIGYLGVTHVGLRRDARATRSDASATRRQVENSHNTNLRDDLDAVKTSLELVLTGQTTSTQLIRSHGYELGHLRRDIQQERTERTAINERVDGILRRLDESLGT